MSNLTKPFYTNKKPQANELVLVVLTEKSEEGSNFQGTLVEYLINAFLRFEDATKKKRVTSWINIVPLNKEIIARVDDINFSEDAVKISLTYMDEKDKDDSKFKKNRTLSSLVKKIIFELNNSFTIDDVILIYNDIWEKIFYKIDSKRYDEYEIEEMPMLLDYCIQEIDVLKEYFSENLPFYEKFKESLNELNAEKPYKLISTIGIISSIGASSTVKLLESVLTNIKYKYSLTYDYYKEDGKKSFPAFVFETASNDSNEENHSSFIKMLETEGGKLNPKSFVKTFEKCKKV